MGSGLTILIFLLLRAGKNVGQMQLIEKNIEGGVAQKHQNLTEAGTRGSGGSASSPKGGADGVMPHIRICPEGGPQGPSPLRMPS